MLLPRRLVTSLFQAAVPSARPTSSQCLLPRTHNPIRPVLPSRLHQLRSITTTPIPAASTPFRLTSSSSSNTPPKPETETHSEIQPETETAHYRDPNAYYSPYKPKRQWPPDLSKLSPKHQFRLERKYRRRAALKYARPKWTKFTKLAQWFSIAFVLIYAMLFMEWDEKGGPFDDLRKAFFGGLKGAFSTPAPPRPIKQSDEEK
ncbi:uncharacterized protein BP01DRAFT_340577 [Aspergillus saccharolyticus JOP 1030-1]|uniref:Uncharacterized protein n=1 Tax=Aspergillus saccharolyticus JOP 1030-1 TaxID=1450539 RepID=A0A318ZCS3_9EURO|nr:hypothetical protein BP01DRAFT_340577 [Aspergillus saccharolyticus JOP 1030-1]PYH45266.1 hypothetical protein BP01DRAFT_340577 [Aspergillus saccharolyticus JOP 1030-1]